MVIETLGKLPTANRTLTLDNGLVNYEHGKISKSLGLGSLLLQSLPFLGERIGGKHGGVNQRLSAQKDRSESGDSVRSQYHRRGVESSAEEKAWILHSSGSCI